MVKSVILSAALLFLIGHSASAAPHISAPVTIPASNSASAAAVQTFLTDRTTGHLQKAYALLSVATQEEIPYAQFQFVQSPLTGQQTPKDAPKLRAVLAFLLDPRNNEKYNYFVLGALPNAPNTVLVRAQALKTDAIYLIKVAAVPAAGEEQPRLDLMQSAFQTDPHGMKEAQRKAKQIASLSNLDQIGLCIMQYAQDHHDRFPDADRWVDEIMPYVQHQSLFHNPLAPASQRWGYAYNRNLSGKKLALVQQPAKTVAVYESTAGIKNANDTGQSVPKPGPNAGSIGYLFTDGHAKRLPSGAKPSFQLNGK